MPKKNKRRRYRLKPHIAKKLGLEVKHHYNKYTLTKEQEKAYLNIPEGHQIKRLFFDIETSPMITYTWRIGWKINLNPDNIIQDWKVICICWKWEGEDKVHSLTWDKNHCDKKMLEEFIKVANEADEIIAHNGDRFDIKKIRTRCIYHRIDMFPNYRSLDTLKKAKSGFNFNSNKLDYIAKFLGVGAKLQHEGFQMWVKCMKGDKKALEDMVEYCKMDIIVLEDVFFVMQNYIKHNNHAGVIGGGYKHECPNCGSDDTDLLKNNFTAAGTPKRLMECNTCAYTYEISNTAYRNKVLMDEKIIPKV